MKKCKKCKGKGWVPPDKVLKNGTVKLDFFVIVKPSIICPNCGGTGKR